MIAVFDFFILSIFYKMKLASPEIIILPERKKESDKYIHFAFNKSEYMLNEVSSSDDGVTYKLVPAILKNITKVCNTLLNFNFKYKLIEKTTSSFYFTAKVLSELESEVSISFYIYKWFLNGCQNLHPYNKKKYCRKLAQILSNNKNSRVDYQNLSNMIIFDFLQEKQNKNVNSY